MVDDLTYVCSWEAWWCDRNRPQYLAIQGGPEDDRWDVVFEETRFNDEPGLRLEVFDSAFHVFGELPPKFWERLAAGPTTLEALRVILVALGFADETQHDRPTMGGPMVLTAAQIRRMPGDRRFVPLDEPTVG